MGPLVLVLLSLLCHASAKFEPYKVLEANRRDSIQDIRQSYKRLAREYHPDKNGGDREAEARFIEITRAYELLSDPERRKQVSPYNCLKLLCSRILHYLLAVWGNCFD